MSQHKYDELTAELDGLLNEEEVSTITVLVETPTRRLVLECVPVPDPVKLPVFPEMYGLEGLH